MTGPIHNKSASTTARSSLFLRGTMMLPDVALRLAGDPVLCHSYSLTQAGAEDR